MVKQLLIEQDFLAFLFKKLEEFPQNGAVLEKVLSIC